MITKVNISPKNIDSQERKDKIERVALEFHTIINSNYFYDQVMKMKKWGETSKFKDAPNVEIYQMIMRGAEVLDPVVDNEIDIEVSTYWSLRRVIGYTYPNIKTVFVNTRYFDSNSTKLVGSNLLHEYGHKLGFNHDFRATTRRPFSICYQLNNCYEIAYDKIFGKQVDRIKVCERSWRTLWLRKVCRWIEV